MIFGTNQGKTRITTAVFLAAAFLLLARQLLYAHVATFCVTLLFMAIARPAVTAAIASATTLDQLHDLVEATRLTLDENSLELLDVASAYQAPPARKAG